MKSCKDHKGHTTHLDKLVPTRRNNNRVLGIRTEPHTRDPFSMPLICNGKFTVSKRVPELNGPITRSRDDLTIVGAERYGKNVVGMAYETASGSSRTKFPQS